MGFRGLQLFKKITGKSLAKLDTENNDMEDFVPAIFYAGLVHEDKELTLEITTDLIDKNLGVAEALKLLPELMEATFGKEEDLKNVQRAASKNK
jgi:hypothetical protein